jgi:hypothetical protein
MQESPDTKIYDLVREFFKILDYQESTDSGHMFHPTTISCCRVMEMEKLEKVLIGMKNEVTKTPS